VGKRVFTCATTPAPFGSFFSRFVDTVKARNLANDFFFRLVNHSLVCEECAERAVSEKCAHRLMLIPPWKSLIRIKKMRSLVPESRMLEFEAEVLGVLAKRNNGYIPAKLVDALLARPELVSLECNRHESVYIAVDPPSHQSSRFGLAAIMYGDRGEIVILGLAELPATRCDTLQLQAMVGEFVRLVRKHPWVGMRTVVPIVECNNNSVLALSLLTVVQRHPPTSMPFIRSYFATDITDRVGVLTTETNKAAMCHITFSALLDGRVFLARGAVSVGRGAYDREKPSASFLDTAKLLGLELKSMRDRPDGKISGKVDASQGDDLAMAFMMALYWSATCRALAIS
jgi:hypothetical protein